jgi:hypothetical protein
MYRLGQKNADTVSTLAACEFQQPRQPIAGFLQLAIRHRFLAEHNRYGFGLPFRLILDSMLK